MCAAVFAEIHHQTIRSVMQESLVQRLKTFTVSPRAVAEDRKTRLYSTSSEETAPIR